MNPALVLDQQRLAADRPTLVHCHDSRHAQDVWATFVSLGVTAEMLGAADLAERRYNLTRRFGAGELPVLIGGRSMVDTLDRSECGRCAGAVMVLAPTQSPVVHLGHYRHTKEDAIVLDYADNRRRLGLPESFKGRVWLRPAAVEDVVILSSDFTTLKG